MAKPKGTGRAWGTYGWGEGKTGLTTRERQVAELLKEGIPQTEISKRLGLSRQRVGQIKKKIEEKEPV